MRIWCGILLLGMWASLPAGAMAQSRASVAKAAWRTATVLQLQALVPERALVEKERIETEMPSASGIIDGRGRMIAAVVLITAGYAAHGKYSHYLVAQVPLQIGSDIKLPAGAYVMGWERVADGLMVHVYEAETGTLRGTTLARPQTQPSPVVPVKLWPPSDRGVIQIGRFALPYTPGE